MNRRKNKTYYSAICTECDREYFYTYTELHESGFILVCNSCGNKLHINKDIALSYKK